MALEPVLRDSTGIQEITGRLDKLIEIMSASTEANVKQGEIVARSTVDKAIEWLYNNPEYIEQPYREAAIQSGFSDSTMYRAMKKVKKNASP
jgi:hypothetical protein